MPIRGPIPMPIDKLMKQPSEMRGIREALAHPVAGPLLVSFRIEGKSAYTVASFTSANRATLITLTLDPGGEFSVSQYLLPLGHLVEHLDPFVAERINLAYPVNADTYYM